MYRPSVIRAMFFLPQLMKRYETALRPAVSGSDYDCIVVIKRYPVNIHMLKPHPERRM